MGMKRYTTPKLQKHNWDLVFFFPCVHNKGSVNVLMVTNFEKKFMRLFDGHENIIQRQKCKKIYGEGITQKKGLTFDRHLTLIGGATFYHIFSLKIEL